MSGEGSYHRQGSSLTSPSLSLPPAPAAASQAAQAELRATRNELGQALAQHTAVERRLKEELQAALERERDGFDVK